MNNLFKALDDPTRRKILEMLKGGSLNAGQISAAFDMKKPSISKHLEILKNANLVSAAKKGQYVFYTLNRATLRKVINILQNLADEPQPAGSPGKNQD